MQKFQVPILKNVEFCIFCQKADHGCVYLFFFFVFCCFFIPRSAHIEPVVLEC